MAQLKKVQLVTPSSSLNQSSDGMLVRKGDFDPVIDVLNTFIASTSSAGVLTPVSVTTSGAISVGTTLAVTGAVTFSSTINYKAQVTDTGGVYATPVVLTAAQSGRVVLVDDAAGLDFTLPAIATAEIGTKFEFKVTTTITSNNFRVTAGAGDFLVGAVWITDFDTANTGSYFAANGSSHLVCTMNGSTKGGKVGTSVTFTAISATQWFVEGIVFGDGALATPFS